MATRRAEKCSAARAVVAPRPLLRDGSISFWLADYAPEVIATEAQRYPSVDSISEALGDIEVTNVPIPLDCADGFNEAYYGRPEMLPDPAARASCSAWSFVDPATSATYVQHLQKDLADGTWDERYGHLRVQASFTGSLVLVVGR